MALAATLLVAFAPQPAAAFNDCAAPGYLAEVDDRFADTGFACIEAARFGISTPKGSREVRIVHTADLPTTDLPAMLREVRRGVQQSAAGLSALGELAPDDITIWISHLLPSPAAVPEGEDDDFDLLGQAATVGDGCLFAVYPGATGRRALAATTAHEFFHCVQASELPASYGARAGAWWQEGTADWFATLAVHDADISAAIDAFDAASPDTALTSMQYASVVFFSWLAQARGAEAIVQLMRAMPAAGGEAAQQQALASFMAPAQWQAFAQDYLDRRIRRPDGRVLATAPFAGDIYVWSDARSAHALSARPFVLARAQLEFACGNWSIRETRASGARAYREQGASWQDALPDRIVVGASGPRLFQMAGFGSESGGVAVSVEAIKDACQSCGTPDRAAEDVNSCLIGSWELVSGGYGAEIRRQLEKTGIFERADYPDLHRIFVLQANGRYSQGPSDGGEPGDMRARTPGGKLWTGMSKLRLNTEGSWSTHADTLYLCEELRSASMDLTLIHPEGHAERLSAGREVAEPMALLRRRQFACDRDRLSLTEELPGAAAIHWEYRRR